MNQWLTILIDENLIWSKDYHIKTLRLYDTLQPHCERNETI